MAHAARKRVVRRPAQPPTRAPGSSPESAASSGSAALTPEAPDRDLSRVPPGLRKHVFKPGESGNTNGTTKDPRKLVVKEFLDLLRKKADRTLSPIGNTYAEVLLQRILASEHLTAKLMDKLLPTLTPEQTNVFVNNFEARLAQIRMERDVASDPPGVPPLGAVPPVSAASPVDAPPAPGGEGASPEGAEA